MSGIERVITVCRADPIVRDRPVQGITLDITGDIPPQDYTIGFVLEEADEFFQGQAEKVNRALSCLPGGTLSHLFAIMAADRANVFRVAEPRPDPVAPAATTDDVVDARIHEADCDGECPECLGEARDHIAAALRIHAPCHDSTTGTWECRLGCSDSFTGQPDRPARCLACIDGDEELVAYPCPTARALGITVWLEVPTHA